MVQVLSVARRVKETWPETAPPRVKTQMARSGVFSAAWARLKRVRVRYKGVNIVGVFLVEFEIQNIVDFFSISPDSGFKVA